MAHNGVLFLDELPEFDRNVIESLRQPLEDCHVTVARALKTSQFPAKIMLVASMNPCPCGWYTDPKKECHCTPNQIQKYMSKISGPLLDRIDIHLEVPALRSTQILHHSKTETSDIIKERTTRARKIQQKRFSAESESLPRRQAGTSGGKETRTFANAQMNQKQIKKYCIPSQEGSLLLKTAIEELGFSARAHDKILKVARTIADLEGKENILPEHIAEAIQYRCLDRGWWG